MYGICFTAGAPASSTYRARLTTKCQTMWVHFPSNLLGLGFPSLNFYFRSIELWFLFDFVKWYAPDSVHDSTFCSIDTFCVTVCRVHKTKAEKCVAFDCMDMGRIFYPCSVHNVSTTICCIYYADYDLNHIVVFYVIICCVEHKFN